MDTEQTPRTKALVAKHAHGKYPQTAIVELTDLAFELERENAELLADKEIIRWLSARCFFPNDHPNAEICVLVPLKFAKNGAFTCNEDGDEKAFRAALDAARKEQP